MSTESAMKATHPPTVQRNMPPREEESLSLSQQTQKDSHKQFGRIKSQRFSERLSTLKQKSRKLVRGASSLILEKDNGDTSTSSRKKKTDKKSLPPISDGLAIDMHQHQQRQLKYRLGRVQRGRPSSQHDKNTYVVLQTPQEPTEKQQGNKVKSSFVFVWDKVMKGLSEETLPDDDSD